MAKTFFTFLICFLLVFFPLISPQSHKLQFSVHSEHQPSQKAPLFDDATTTNAAAPAATVNPRQPPPLPPPPKKTHTNGSAQPLPKRTGPIYGKTTARQFKHLQKPSSSAAIASSISSPAHVFSLQSHPQPASSTTTTKSAARNRVPVITTASKQSTSHPTLKLTATSTLSSSSSALVSTQLYPATTPAATCITSFAPANKSRSNANGSQIRSSSSQPKATSPLAAQLPPTPPSSSPLYSAHYTAAQHVAGHGLSHSSSSAVASQTHLVHSSINHPAAVVQPPATIKSFTSSKPASANTIIKFAKPASSASSSISASTAKQTAAHAKRQTPANHNAAAAAATSNIGAAVQSTSTPLLLPPMQKRGSKRSHSQCTHHEALQRIDAHSDFTYARSKPPPSPPKPAPAPTSPAVVVSFIRNTASGATRPQVSDWHAPGAEVFDLGFRSTDDPAADVTAESGQLLCVSPPPPPLHVQRCWFHPPTVGAASVSTTRPNRTQRLHDRLHQLQGQARQLRVAQHSRTGAASLARMSAVNQTLAAKQRLVAAEAAANAATRCALPTCQRTALLLASHCAVHITLDARQRLFSECTAKFANNSQCRRPAVFGARAHEMPLCREHAWKRVSSMPVCQAHINVSNVHFICTPPQDNYTRIVQEQKLPRKTVQRKKTAKSDVTTPARPAAATTAAGARRQRNSSAKKPKQPKRLSRGKPSMLSEVERMSSLLSDGLQPSLIVNDTNSNSSFMAHHTEASSTSMLMGQSPPNTLNHFTISSNDSFVSSNDATNFASSAHGTNTTTNGSVGGTSNDMGGTSSCLDYGTADSLQATGFHTGLGGLHDGNADALQTAMLSSGISDMCGDSQDQQQMFQPQQFQHQQQQFQQPQNMYAYGQQYQQQSVFMPSPYAHGASSGGHGHFFSHSQHSQNSSDSAATSTAMHTSALGVVGTRLTDTMFTMSENSSAYESSEDTGLGGGLSESEQHLGVMHDGEHCVLNMCQVGVILTGDRFRSYHQSHTDLHEDDAVAILGDHVDLNNVLSQLNTNVFEDIFTGKFGMQQIGVYRR